MKRQRPLGYRANISELHTTLVDGAVAHFKAYLARSFEKSSRESNRKFSVVQPARKPRHSGNSAILLVKIMYVSKFRVS